ncbi:hypothetical protein WJX73_001480 [Symbiochloris irregularis]|uniref:2Fe-2S ferredoxin-type domain-containing protein n=1 Tax=Symbiochloris irregularis TaxID=706552 RepID=A0AAW1PQX9_9CHLO
MKHPRRCSFHQAGVQARRATRRFVPAAYKVEIQGPNGSSTIEVEEGETILQTALDQGIELSHDCKMGVCMTCPAKLVSGEVDQSAGMLDDTAKEKGYALLCVSEPQSDCKVAVIEEDEILEEVLCSSK